MNASAASGADVPSSHVRWKALGLYGVLRHLHEDAPAYIQNAACVPSLTCWREILETHLGRGGLCLEGLGCMFDIVWSATGVQEPWVAVLFELPSTYERNDGLRMHCRGVGATVEIALGEACRLAMLELLIRDSFLYPQTRVRLETSHWNVPLDELRRQVAMITWAHEDFSTASGAEASSPPVAATGASRASESSNLRRRGYNSRVPVCPLPLTAQRTAIWSSVIPFVGAHTLPLDGQLWDCPQCKPTWHHWFCQYCDKSVPPAWTKNRHFGGCGQSCRCCRQANGEALGACTSCQELCVLRTVSRLMRRLLQSYNGR